MSHKNDNFTCPIGTILSFSGDTPPTGWLLCDGAELNRITYDKLFSVIVTKWGYGNNSTTFNLPDLRGRFLRGRDKSAGKDPDANSRVACMPGGSTGDNVGSIQGGSNASHNHTGSSGDDSPDHCHHPGFNFTTLNFTMGGGNTAIMGQGGGGSWGSGCNTRHQHIISISPNGGNESRPINAYVNYIIRAF